MPFYQNSGVLVFGSRLRRISEAFLADVNSIYKHHGIRFDAAWFPIFYMLSHQGALSIREISIELEVSHSAASQLVSKLVEKGLIRSGIDKNDARKKVVSFTPKGQKLLQQVQPIWTAVQKAMDQLLEEMPHGKLLMPAIGELEKSFQQSTIFDRIEKQLQ
ncbi:MarR family winged helix-turn-helix transcriptional regulator [Flavihumibacter fluvii]|uniref:MarR family winged helix-turn-helix transcriptional regulator n=1 Tax=Flavihumibacter fluvii TaxID=2838157 RepID=UPI001BDE82A3|nr:MarR family transcriptional regulator [Flavihumibacter fluvii]ULQ54019.1 MarR family transcriptional regulator [Flavihumibacter fluvii]